MLSYTYISNEGGRESARDVRRWHTDFGLRVYGGYTYNCFAHIMNK